MDKKYLSATQIGMFLRCGRQYEFRYIQGIKRPPNGAMFQGRVWHKAIERNYAQKVSSGTDLSLSDMKEFFAAEYEKGLQHEEVNFEGENAGTIKDEGMLITSTHHQTIAPKVRPILVEEEFRVSLGQDFPFDLLGYWDVVDDHGVIIDNKSYSKSPTQESVDTDLQLSLYSLAYRIKTGQIERGLRIDSVVKNKTPKVVQVETSRTNSDCQWLLGLIEGVAKAIRSGIFYPNPTGYLCSPKWCGYWGLCRK